MKYLLITLFSLALTGLTLIANGSDYNLEDPYEWTAIDSEVDTFPKPIQDRFDNDLFDPPGNPFDLDDPSIIEKNVEYDPETDSYIITEKIGDFYYRAPTYMTFQEYSEWKQKQMEADYFKQLSDASSGKTAFSAGDPIAKFDLGNALVDRLFGGTKVDIRPQGNIDLTFGVDYQNVQNPILTERQRRSGGFDFDMDIRLNVVGKIGEKLQLTTNYNTQATFDFENQMKLEYTGFEDDIIKKIEAGNVSLPLKSSLIQGSQSLFGLKTELQFGRLTLTSVFSQQKSRRQETQIQGGTQLQNFEITADQYDENRHFFLSHFNRSEFEPAQRSLPQVNTLFKITRIEVWVTNTRNETQDVRDIVAFTDLGEGEEITNTMRINPNPSAPRDLKNVVLPDNEANDLYGNITSNIADRDLVQIVTKLQTDLGLQEGQDFLQVRARKLKATEFDFHPELGYISLNTSLNPSDIVGVSYQYTYNGEGPFSVGELAQSSPQSVDTTSQGVLFVKMLKGTTMRVDLPLWDLMMKNVYSLGAFQVNPDEFNLDIFYQDPGGGEIRNLPEGTSGAPLIRLLNMDNLNRQSDPFPDGVFDFVSGITINPRSGKVIFPVLEPFGSSLEAQMTDPGLAQKYTYPQLYDSTITRAREFPEFNRFVIKGNYRSSVSSEISLGSFNIPRGSVTVRAGGQVLTEGVHYTIDYNIGRIKILDGSLLNSGVPVNVSYEDNTLFSFQTKTLMGARADYWINDNFTLGGTVMRLSERPFTQKVNVGDDPIANTVYGFDVNYKTEAPLITRIVDRIPLIDTKEPSDFTFTGEVAYLDPGEARAIRENGESVVYIDDFEGSASRIDLRTPANAWVLASTPKNENFPEASLVDDLDYGKNRAKINWYRIDNGLRRDAGSLGPYERSVRQEEVFPNRQLQPGENTTIQTFDLTYYPDERGPYNFDVEATDYSAGMNPNGSLRDPKSRWGGIMRSLTTTDFEAANIEFVEFWMLSPYLDGNPTPEGEGGNLYINLGEVSEDILKDSRQFFENTLPKPDDLETPVDVTEWGRIARSSPITNAFDNDEATRASQDVGLDGLSTEQELDIFSGYLDRIEAEHGTNNDAYRNAELDPSNDDYLYYNDESFSDDISILNRYRQYNNPENNSQPPAGNTLSAATNNPDSEDINRDNSLNREEAYFQYKVPLQRDGDGVVISEFVTDTVNTANGTWYQYKIPIEEFLNNSVGGKQDLRAVRFIRMYMDDFEYPVTMRFARLELVRNQWRRYIRDLVFDEPFGSQVDDDDVEFDVTAVNIEENSGRTPFPYVLPPGIQREQSIGPFPDALQNEQSLALNVCNLPDKAGRAIYKILNLDMRTFESMRMFVHAESQDDLPKGALRMFMRLGSDFEENYYEYEIPLTMSDNPAASPIAEEVWREENEFNFKLSQLKDIKIQRNADGFPLREIFEQFDPERPDNILKVKGNPDIGLVKGVMVGVYNPEDDGVPICAEVWVNELRVSGFRDLGGMAGLARAEVTLADFGNLSGSLNYSSIGWGALEQKIAQRAKEEVLQYDFGASFELGKFFNKNSGIKIPFLAQWSTTTRTPEFDPYTRDIPLKELLAAETDAAERDSLRRQAQDYTGIKSFNFTNVRKERTKKDKAPMPWDIENISLTYAYTETEKSDPTIKEDLVEEHLGAIDYSYSPKTSYVKPFNKVKGKWFKWVKEFNFNPVPNSVNFGTDMQRIFGQTTYRFSDGATWFDKRFTWNRNYGLSWNLAKSLKFNFNAQNNAIVEEPQEVDLETGIRIDPNLRNEAIWSSIRDWGRTRGYSHTANASYSLPLKYIPAFDWINAKASYAASYGWNAQSLTISDTLGAVVQNGQNRQINFDLNFEKLYNKSKYLKKINSGKKGKKGRDSKEDRKKKENKIKESLTGGEDIGKVLAEDEKAKAKAKKKKQGEPSTAARVLIRPLMLIRKARLNYTENFSTIIPGYMPQTHILGMNDNFAAPGWDFVAGIQPQLSYLDEMAGNGWITRSVYLNQKVNQNYSQTIDATVKLEPFKNFKIDLTANRNYTRNHTEDFKIFEPGGTEYDHKAQIDGGSLTFTYFTLNTLFDDILDNFDQFEANRTIISSRVGIDEEDHQLEGAEFRDGYGRYQQDVLIPAFLAAYSGQDASTYELDVFDVIPLPNWKLSYNGLGKLPGLNKVFQSVNLTHSYKSTLSVNNYTTDLRYSSAIDDGLDPLNDLTLNYYSEFEIPNINITEAFSPLIGVDVRMKNDLSVRFDWKKSRNLAMSFVDYRLAETKTSDFTVGFGYKVKGFKLPFKVGKGKKKTNKLENDLNFKFDFSYRDDVTINHLLDQNISEPTRGAKTIRISPSIDYAVNKRLNLRLFFERSQTIPATSASFPITNTRAGVTVRFNLSD